jgi:hypothetical protein
MYDHHTGRDESAPTTHADFGSDEEPLKDDAIRPLRVFHLGEARS